MTAESPETSNESSSPCCRTSNVEAVLQKKHSKESKLSEESEKLSVAINSETG